MIEQRIKNKRKEAIRKEHFLFRLLILLGAVRYNVSYDKFHGYRKTYKVRAWHPLTWIVIVLIIIFSIPKVIWDAFKGMGTNLKKKLITVNFMNKRAIKQWIARTLLFLPSESAGQMMRRYRKKLDDINELKGTDYGLFLMDWSKMLSDENNMESNMSYFRDMVGYGTDATAICLYKRGSDRYVILGRCLYDTKKDADGYRKEYWGNKTDDSIIWMVLDDAIERYNQEQIRSVVSNERGLSVWIARDKDGELCLYKSKPWRCVYDQFDCDDIFLPMDEDMYPEITWENSPKEFELKAVEI